MKLLSMISEIHFSNSALVGKTVPSKNSKILPTVLLRNMRLRNNEAVASQKQILKYQKQNR